MESKSLLAVNLSRDQVKDFAGVLAQIWIEVEETGTLEMDDRQRERYDRTKTLVEKWTAIFNTREALSRMERDL